MRWRMTAVCLRISAVCWRIKAVQAARCCAGQTWVMQMQCCAGGAVTCMWPSAEQALCRWYRWCTGAALSAMQVCNDAQTVQ